MNTQPPASSSMDTFLVENVSELLEFLVKLGISVKPVCFISDRNSKESSTTNSWIFFRENIVVEYSRRDVVALCDKQVIKDTCIIWQLLVFMFI